MAKKITPIQIIGLAAIGLIIYFIANKKSNAAPVTSKKAEDNSPTITIDTGVADNFASTTQANTLSVDGVSSDVEKVETEEEKQAEILRKFNEGKVQRAKDYLTSNGVSVDMILEAGNGNDYIMNYALGKGWSGE